MLHAIDASVASVVVALCRQLKLPDFVEYVMAWVIVSPL